MLTTKTLAYIIAIFAMIGALDRILGNRLGLGEKFEQAFRAMGPLALSMVGMLVISPIIANLLKPLLTSFFQIIGADPAVFAGMFLGTDMGAATLAKELAINSQSGLLAGFVTSSMMGATIVFHIPVAMELAGQDSRYIAKGMMSGFITIPVGCIVGGLVADFPLSLILHDTIPVIIISALLTLGMLRFMNSMTRGFILFGMFILAISTTGLALGILQELTGLTPVKGIGSISNAFSTVCSVSIFLAGAFPLMHVMTTILKKPLTLIGYKLHINDISSVGPIITLVNSIPMLETMKDMDAKGKIINSAFCVSGAFALGDFIGFVAVQAPTMVIPMILGKLTAALLAIIVALILTKSDSDASNADSNDK